MKNILIVFVFGLFFFACGNREQKDSPVISQSFQAERDVFFNSLKTSDEISALALPGTVVYNSDLLSEPLRYTRYLDNQIKSAANLGIYIADLNYNLLFGATQSNQEYFTAAHELSKAVGVEQEILQFLMMRYSKNVSVADSVKVVVNELLQQSTKTLKGTDRERLAGIAMAAYQIENLHLALAALESIPQDRSAEQQNVFQQLSAYVISYKTNVEVSYNFIRSYADPLDMQNNPNFPYFDNSLRELITVYRTIEENVLSDEQLVELKSKVESIRSGVINM